MKNYLFFSLFLVVACFKQIQSTSPTLDPEVITLSPDDPVNPRTRLTFGFGLFAPRPSYVYTTVGPWYRVRIEAACRTLMTVLAIGPQNPSNPSNPGGNRPPAIIPLQGSSNGPQDDASNTGNEANAVPRSLFSRNMMDPYTGIMSFCNRVLTLSPGTTGADPRQ